MKLSDISANTMSIAAPMTFIMTVVAVLERESPKADVTRDLKDVSSSYEDNERSGFQKPERLEQDSNILIAKTDRETAPAIVNGPETIVPRIAYLAYAPADADLDAPFGELLGGGANHVSKPQPIPRSRPKTIDTAKFMTGHGPQRRRPGDHSWAENTLPPHVYKAAQQDCLARGIYFEARGESLRGQAAIGQVILNRVKNPAYPSTICGVVYQNKKLRNRCQFSFACDGVRDRIRSTKRYRIAQRVARQVTDGDVWLSEIGDATHYHATYARPRWARAMKKTDRIGRHIFYRTKTGGLS